MHCLWIVGTWCFLVGGCSRFFSSRRDALLAGSVAFAVVLLLITEALSAMTLFYFLPVMIAWMLATGISAGFCFFALRRTSIHRPVVISSDRIIIACGICIIAVISCIALAAALAPPNTWDSMTYHMARVANWLQHRTVGHYPTQILRQLYLGPWSEFAVANVQILVGSDRLANCVQFGAMLGSIIGVSSIAAKLGVSPRGQAMSALFAATIPIAMLEASSTQTDCVTGFWVVCAINLGLLLKVQTLRHRPVVEWVFAAAIGIAFLTKATSAFVIAPFAGWVVLSQLQSLQFRSARLMVMLIAMPLLLNAGHFYRNWAAFGRVLGPESETVQYQNQIHTPGAIASNGMRNLLMNMAFRGMGHFPVIASRMVRNISGLNVSDPRITWPGTQFDFFYSREEDLAGNPMHLALGLIAFGWAIAAFNKNRRASIYALCLFCGCFLFCYQLKWQPWITRLQLPMFLVVAPLVGMAVDRFSSARISALIIFLLMIQAPSYLLFGSPRILIGSPNVFTTSRADQYFVDRPELVESYTKAANMLNQLQAKSVGLISGSNDWEYPLHVLLSPTIRLMAVGVHNESAGCNPYSPDKTPHYLIQLGSAPIPTVYPKENNSSRPYFYSEPDAYKVIFHGTDISVLARVNHISP